MTTLFGIDMQALVVGALGGQLSYVDLLVVTESIGEHGEPMRSAVEYDAQGVRSEWKKAVSVARGYPDHAAKFLLLATPALPVPKIGDELYYEAECWRIIDVRRDPAGATFECAAIHIDSLTATGAGLPNGAITWGVDGITWGGGYILWGG